MRTSLYSDQLIDEALALCSEIKGSLYTIYHSSGAIVEACDKGLYKKFNIEHEKLEPYYSTHRGSSSLMEAFECAEYQIKNGGTFDLFLDCLQTFNEFYSASKIKLDPRLSDRLFNKLSAFLKKFAKLSHGAQTIPC